MCATIIVQIAITIVVVTLYHLWVSGQKPSAPSAPAAPQPAPVVPPPVQVSPVVAAPVVAAVKAPPAVEAPSPEILAVIAAAIEVFLGRRHRVLAVELPAAHAPATNAWAMEGRVEQFMSHKVR